MKSPIPSDTFKEIKPGPPPAERITIDQDGEKILIRQGQSVVSLSDPEAAVMFAHNLTLAMGEPIAAKIQVSDDMHSYQVVYHD